MLQVHPQLKRVSAVCDPQPKWSTYYPRPPPPRCPPPHTPVIYYCSKAVLLLWFILIVIVRRISVCLKLFFFFSEDTSTIMLGLTWPLAVLRILQRYAMPQHSVCFLSRTVIMLGLTCPPGIRILYSCWKSLPLNTHPHMMRLKITSLKNYDNLFENDSNVLPYSQNTYRINLHISSCLTKKKENGKITHIGK